MAVFTEPGLELREGNITVDVGRFRRFGSSDNENTCARRNEDIIIVRVGLNCSSSC